MKNFFCRVGKKIKDFFAWLWEQIKDWRTLIIFIIVVLIMYFPAYGFYILSLIFKNAWLAGAATLYLTFWAGPFTPFFPLCVVITLAIKKLFLKLKKPKKEKVATESEDHENLPQKDKDYPEPISESSPVADQISENDNQN